MEAWVSKSKYLGSYFGLTVMLDHLALDTTASSKWNQCIEFYEIVSQFDTVSPYCLI